MKKALAVLFCFLMLTMPLAGCFGGGEKDSDTSDEVLDEWNVHFAATFADLPACDENTNGRLYYVEAENHFQVCKTSGWELIVIQGSDGADGQDGTNGKDGLDGNHGIDGLSTLVEISEEPSSSNCVNSGTKVEAGLDSNNNGILDNDEITNIEYICNGISSDTTMLTSISPPPSNKRCTGGGRVISNGFDNGEGSGIASNGQLESDEIDYSTSFCTTRGTTYMGLLSYYKGEMAVYNNELYFIANDGSTGSINVFNKAKLWKTNGTQDELVLVAHIGNSNGDVISFAGMLIFSAYDENNGTELWSYDETNGLKMLADIHPTGSSYPRDFTIWNNNLYFVADDGVHGYELWKYDGTSSLNAVSMVLDINPGSNSSDPQYFTEFNGNYLIFSADDSTHGHELWAVNSAGNTYLYSDVMPGAIGSNPEEITAGGGATLYFSAIGNYGVYGREIYTCSDGGSSGCSLLVDVNPGVGSASPHSMISTSGDLYYFAWDGEQRELWRCETAHTGTCETNEMIDINPFGSSNSITPNAYPFEFHDKLFFNANMGFEGKQLLSFDGNTITIVDTYGANHPIIFNNEIYYWRDTSHNVDSFMVTSGSMEDYTEVTYS